MKRRLLLALLALGMAPAPFATVRPGVPLSFPRDHGAHPAYRTEWWYVTGWLQPQGGGAPLGFQVTFFRTATGLGASDPSAFAPREILFAHAALADPALGHLQVGERIARAGFGLAAARTGDADVRIDDWRFRHLPDGRFVTSVAGQGFALALTLRPTQPVLLEGKGGYSRKGPDPADASRYYSLPHLAVSGQLRRGGRITTVSGTAWFDQEWSSSYLAAGAVGWDWTGLNLDDGASLMAFRMRDAGGRAVWAGGTWRAADGKTTILGPGDVTMVARHRWRSPRTGSSYPVDPVLTVRLPGGIRTFPMTPLMPDQELDTRATGGPVYWEGAVRVPGGRGYLELTGYGGKLSF